MSHAVLSPSSAERWLNCTPSARLEEGFPGTTSVFAEEGTLAHSLGELLIREKAGWIKKKDFKKAFDAIQADELYNESMLEYADEYATHVIECFSEAQSHTRDALLFLEMRLNMTDFVPEGFGTGDAVIIADGVMHINDLKYGKGVPVSSENNKQMMLYSLGALREFDFLYDIHTVRMTIYQPRIGNISTWEISVEDLMKWAEDDLKPRAALAFEGKGEYAPGKHCQFCKAKAVCKALADHNLGIAKYEFKQSDLLADGEVSDILSRAKFIADWLSAVEDYALQQAVEAGKKWPGYKVVEGRSNRKYADETKVAEVLVSKDFKEEDIFKKKLLGITEMEKHVGKKDFNVLLSDLIIKPPGKPTLVPESDKRPEYNSVENAVKDFEGIN